MQANGTVSIDLLLSVVNGQRNRCCNS
uniref:Uncharacterized protein n=1 Tax=Arundo donax TaxID=35708 RepID=A0A0A9H0Y5_ARUDO